MPVIPVLWEAGLELPTSGYPPNLVSLSAGITGMSHCARPVVVFYDGHQLRESGKGSIGGLTEDDRKQLSKCKRMNESEKCNITAK